MPAHPSSRTPSCLRQLGDAPGPAPLEAVVDLRSYLAAVPDPRARRGIRYPWTALLTASAAAVLVGATSITAIDEWVADAPQRVLALLGFRPDPLTGLIHPPHATTIRLVLAAADGDALHRAIGDFLQGRKAPASGRKVIAVDGTTLRGSRTTRQPATALIAAMTHDGQVLAQRQIGGKSNEIPAFAPLLDGIDLTGGGSQGESGAVNDLVTTVLVDQTLVTAVRTAFAGQGQDVGRGPFATPVAGGKSRSGQQAGRGASGRCRPCVQQVQGQADAGRARGWLRRARFRSEGVDQAGGVPGLIGGKGCHDLSQQHGGVRARPAGRSEQRGVVAGDSTVRGGLERRQVGGVGVGGDAFFVQKRREFTPHLIGQAGLVPDGDQSG
ncbi:transposase family protein [Streptomyces sp. NPDC058622]|uniref:transposase family protein n=1 Tax=Streptomyces sp. NPDC058622 TaxID=3346562 RepID=UPI00365C827B